MNACMQAYPAPGTQMLGLTFHDSKPRRISPS
jgi:hypothetical protein